MRQVMVVEETAPRAQAASAGEERWPLRRTVLFVTSVSAMFWCCVVALVVVLA